MPKRIYVGNLPFMVSEKDLHGAAASHGKIEGIEIKQDKANESAMAVIVFEGEGPNTVIEAMNGQVVAGRKIVVSDDRNIVINHEEQ